MKYDFTSIMDRHGKDAIAVDGLGAMPGFTPSAPKEGFDAIPMWVADMNFPTVPTIPEAIIERAKHPAYGYFQPTDEYYGAIIKWQETRNGVTGLTKECIGYENGVLGGVVSALTAFAAPGDAVLLHSPTYIGFTMSIGNNGFKIVHSPLVKDEDGVWRMDYEDMDMKIKMENIHVAVLCSPHNPCGRVWERWELEKAMEIYKANDCVVISDEIWSDIILAGHKHIPTQMVSEDARERTVGVYAPSKTFNLAGLVGSYHIIYNKYLRDRTVAKGSKPHYNDMNVLSMHALLGAYKPEGYEWVDELCGVITENVDYACRFIQEHFEGVEVFKPEGTYMLFLDCTKWCEAHGKTIGELQQAGWDVGVAWQDGRMFHGPCAIRMNLALPLSRVQEAFRRLDKYVFNGGLAEEDGYQAPLSVGDVMEDFTFDTPFTQGRTLMETLKAAPKTAILFLRYYGCTLCQMDIHQLAKDHGKITAGGGQLLLVLQSEREVVSSQISEDTLPFEIICDPEQALYKRFGIQGAEDMRAMVDGKAFAKLAKAAVTGYRHGKYEGNELQLPAAFVVDANGKVGYAHYGKTVSDFPDAEKLARVLAE